MSDSVLSNIKRRKISKSIELTNNISTATIVQNNGVKSDFYNESCEVLAKKLLGSILVRKLECGTVLRGKIVETESYLGLEDKASHTYNGRRTITNEPMYMKPGTTYVYFTYGMYYCFNISSKEPGAAVLLRAVEPLEGLEQMQNYRKTKKRTKELKTKELCNGPSKLCISFNINKNNCNKLDLAENPNLWIEVNKDKSDIKIVTSTRIGINSAGEEWANKPLRFYILGNESVSKRDKIVEQIILERST